MTSTESAYSVVVLQVCKRAVAVLCTVFALALAPSNDVLAQSNGKNQAAARAAYDKAFNEGNALFDKKRWAKARAKYQKAWKIRQDPLLLFNIGATYRREGNYVEALLYFRRCVAAAPPNEGYVQMAKDVIVELQSKLQAQQEAAESSTDKPARKSGPDSASKDTATNDQSYSSEVEMKPDPVDGDMDPGQTSRRVGATLLAVGGAAMGWALYEAYRSRQLSSDLSDVPDGAVWTEEAQEQHDRGQTAQTRARVLPFIGGALIAAGTLYYLRGRKQSSSGSSTDRASGDKRAKRSLTILPMATEESWGIVFHSLF